MLMYGICSSNIKKVKWESVKEMLKEFDADLYEEFVKDLDGDLSNSNMEDWFSKYENDGRFGIGAFLKDYIEFKEDIILNIDDPDGTFIGVSAGAPWDFVNSLKDMDEADFDDLLRKYVNLITDEPLVIRWWKVDDDLDW